MFKYDWQYMRVRKINKFLFYVNGYSNLAGVRLGVKKNLRQVLKHTAHYDDEYIRRRINYYNQLNTISTINVDSTAIKALNKPTKQSAYYFDLIEYTSFFDRKSKLNYLFGDITHVPPQPTLVKSRPTIGDNKNSVLFKLDKARHFKFVKDNIAFADKKDMLIGRGVVTQPHRIDFYEKYFDNPLCNLGKVNANGVKSEWVKPAISIAKHLHYKFILSLEGNDVATNLKWIMSSSSIAVMPKPKYETWFMEGTLEPDKHYICISDDYSNLEEKLKYYINHPEKALQITRNANEYVKQFHNDELEKIISILVLDKYFYYTGQCAEKNFDY